MTSNEDLIERGHKLLILFPGKRDSHIYDTARL